MSKVFTSVEIEQAIRTQIWKAVGAGPVPPQTECWPMDPEYRVPARKRDFADSMVKEWEKFRKINDILPYSLEDNDCDDYGFHMASCLRNWNAHLRSEGYALAAGVWICYPMEHVFNFFIWGRDLKLVGFEPQDSFLREIKPNIRELWGRNLFIF